MPGFARFGRPSKALTVVSVITIIFIAAWIFAERGIRTTQPETLRQLVARSVPIGASPEDVRAFLDGQHLEYGSMNRTSNYSNLRKYGDMPVIGAIKRHTWVSLLMYEDIQIAFIFDKNNRLKTVDLNPVYTGL
jgi:hypothetical protein